MGLAIRPALLLTALLSPAPVCMSPAGWGATGVALLMASWWIAEAVPIAVTALLPLVLFPLLGVAPITAAATPYARACGSIS